MSERQKWEYLVRVVSGISTKTVIKQMHPRFSAEVSKWQDEVFRFVFHDNYWWPMNNLLDELGRNGWELVAVTPHHYVQSGQYDFGGYPDFYFIFKRPV